MDTEKVRGIGKLRKPPVLYIICSVNMQAMPNVPAPLTNAAGARPEWTLVLQIISLAYLQLPRHSKFDN